MLDEAMTDDLKRKKSRDRENRSTHSSTTMGPGLISSISIKAKHFVLVNFFLGL